MKRREGGNGRRSVGDGREVDRRGGEGRKMEKQLTLDTILLYSGNEISMSLK